LRDPVINMDIMDPEDLEDLGGPRDTMKGEVEDLVGHKAALGDLGVEGREVIREVEDLEDRAGQEGQEGKGDLEDLEAGDNAADVNDIQVYISMNQILRHG
jgi:hypothetical protein